MKFMSNRFWLILLSAVVIASAIAALLLNRITVSYAYIYHNNTLTETVNLVEITEPQYITIEGGNGTNVILLERGRVRMLTADCPDGICVRQGWVSRGVTPIVCLPNRVVIRLEGGDTNIDVDAVVG
ncbi:MAG: NusG domain II-containing protein [Oscillospiraceae bacterium]|jgi:hypothetical protein|nr:NusG domain II-containing protein [Oscillospiraceae bacterium]